MVLTRILEPKDEQKQDYLFNAGRSARIRSAVEYLFSNSRYVATIVNGGYYSYLANPGPVSFSYTEGPAEVTVIRESGSESVASPQKSCESRTDALIAG